MSSYPIGSLITFTMDKAPVEGTVADNGSDKGRRPVKLDDVRSAEELDARAAVLRAAVISNRGHLITFRDPSDQRLRTATADLIRDELAGKNLACACPADVPCHADALLAIANGELP